MSLLRILTIEKLFFIPEIIQKFSFVNITQNFILPSCVPKTEFKMFIKFYISYIIAMTHVLT